MQPEPFAMNPAAPASIENRKSKIENHYVLSAPDVFGNTHVYDSEGNILGTLYDPATARTLAQALHMRDALERSAQLIAAAVEAIEQHPGAHPGLLRDLRAQRLAISMQFHVCTPHPPRAA